MSKGHCQEKLTTKLIKSSCLFRSGAGWGVQRQGILAFNFKCLVLFYFLNMSTHCSSKNAHTHIHRPPPQTHTWLWLLFWVMLNDLPMWAESETQSADWALCITDLFLPRGKRTRTDAFFILENDAALGLFPLCSSPGEALLAKPAPTLTFTPLLSLGSLALQFPHKKLLELSEY